MKFLKAGVAILSLFLIANASAANWIKIVESGSGTKYFIDSSTVIYLQGLNRVNFNVKANEPKRDSLGNISYLENRIVNCQDGIHALIFVQGYDRLDLQGREAKREYIDKPIPHQIKAGTIGGELALAACRMAK